MGNFADKFGPQYSKPRGYVAEPGNAGSYKHRFGGASWKVFDDQPVEDGPALLLVLDLSDPKLAELGITSCEEIPVCSYINSDVWLHEQVYKIDHDSKAASLLNKTTAGTNILDNADRMPNPLPEKSVTLREMDSSEYPVDEDLYWENTEEFLGGKSFFRVAGNPLWLQDTDQVNCSCDTQMKFLMCIGYEGWADSFQYLDDEPFFLGESALYYFFCDNCKELRVISQSS